MDQTVGWGGLWGTLSLGRAGDPGEAGLAPPGCRSERNPSKRGGNLLSNICCQPFVFISVGGFCSLQQSAMNSRCKCLSASINLPGAEERGELR